MKPAPPVTNTFLGTLIPLWTIEFEEETRRIDNLGVLSGGRSFAQLHGRLVEHLGEQLACKRFYGFAVLLAQMTQGAQCALDFLCADLLRAVAQLTDQRNNFERAVPVPEFVQAFANDGLGKRHFGAALLERAFDHLVQVIEVVEKYILDA